MEVGMIGALSKGVPRRRGAQGCGGGFGRGDEVTFRQRHHRARDPEIGEDLQVFLGLWHPAVVGCDDEKRRVHRADASNHVLDEILVSRHVNQPETESRQREVREAEVDGDAARLFLRQPVGIGAGQRAPRARSCRDRCARRWRRRNAWQASRR